MRRAEAVGEPVETVDTEIVWVPDRVRVKELVAEDVRLEEGEWELLRVRGGDLE